MREIEYRGKDKLSGEWVYGYYYKMPNPITVFLCDYILKVDFDEERVSASTDVFVVDKETLGQYIGVKDKNGKKIFEGDIIDIHQTVNGCNLFEIVWDKTKWNARYAVNMVKPRLYEYDFNELLDVDVYEKEIEVIGNIYDNKELVEMRGN